MPLKEQQDLLARLYTDPELQAEFYADPSAVLNSHGINDDEAEGFLALADSEIKFFADSLVTKRFRETRKLLSVSANHLGPRFREHFIEFAAKFIPTSGKKHTEDAIAFCKHLLERSDLSNIERDAVAFESARLSHVLETRKISFVLLRHDPRSLSNGVQDAVQQGGLAVWITPSKDTRFTFIKLPFL
jgi:hypothetical protein